MGMRELVSRRLVLAATWVVPSLASGNGNVSHQWVTDAAIANTPRTGSLAAVVTDPSLLEALHTGTMFPDWGYAPGSTMLERAAGEASHWEPVQDAYRAWILEQYAPPWSDEARRHLAFWLGMTSHGIADQTYDSMFFERSKFYQGGDHGAFDQDTDVMWAATTGPGTPPRTPLWIPNEPLLPLFAEIAGADVDAGRLADLVGLVGTAIALVNALGGDAGAVADAEAAFAWAALHDDDPLTPGNPPHEAEVVRRYWRSNWALVHGDPVPRPVLWTHPADGGTSHPIEAASIESWITIVFARGLDSEVLSASQFHVVPRGGAEVPIAIDLFYRGTSHVVHVQPTVDLDPDTVYVVTVDPGVATIHGESLDGWDFTFSTGRTAPTPLHDDGFWDEPDPYDDGEPPGGTGDTSGAGTTGTDGTATDGTGADSAPGSTSSGAPVGDDTSISGPPAADVPSSSCACRHRAPTPGRFGLLAALGLLAAGRRRRR